MKSFTAFNEMVSNKKQKEAIESAKLDRKSALKVASKTYKEDTELEEGLKQARKNVGMDPNKPSCWKGYKATGTKMKGGKQVPDCKKEEVELEEKKNCNHSKKGVECDEHGTEDCTDKVEEGTKYGLYKGSGKPGGAMKAFLDKRAKKLEAEKKKQKPEYRNNPAFGDASHHSNAKNRTEGADIADILARLEKKRISKGGDPKDSPLPAMKKYHADKAKKKIKESVEKEKEEADGTPSSVEEEIKMTRKAYNKLHKDFKSDDPKKPRTTKYVPGKGTVSMPVKFVDEAKVDQGRSDYGKASIRNYRRMGPGHDDPGMFDPSGKRGKTIDKRREEHKARRGVKGAKVPAYKVEEKDTSAMKKFLDDKAKKLEKKRNSQSDAAKNNPHFDSTSSMPRSRVYAGLQLSGDSRLGKLLEGLTAKERMKRDAGAIAKKKMRQKEHNKYVNFLDVDEALHPNVARNDAINKANAMKRAKEREASKPSADVIAARKRQYKGGSDYTTADKKKVIQSYKKEETILETPKGDAGKDTPTKQADRAARSYGSGYGAKYNAPARKTIHKMKRGVKKYKGEKENNDGSTKMTNFIDDRKSHFHTQGKSYDEPSRKKMKKEEVAISEKIKYDSKGSSMDYFLGKDPKKTKYYKDNKKKNESKSSCECKHESFSDFLKEGNATGRMLHKSKTQVTGHISADRGSDEKKNQSKRKGLEKDLKKHGIGHKKGVGEYKYDSGETGREVSYQTSKPDKMSKRRFGKVMRRLGRKHGQESVITKDKDKPAKLHTTEKGSKQKSETIGKSKAGKHPQGYGETSGTKVRSAKLPKKTNKSSYHYG